MDQLTRVLLNELALARAQMEAGQIHLDRLAELVTAFSMPTPSPE